MRREQGFTVFEGLMAALLLVVGVIAVFSAFDGSRLLGSVAETKQVAARRAEAEIERLRSVGWAALRLDTSPGTFADSRGTSASASYSPPGGGTAEALVVAATACTAAAPCVTTGPTPWSDGATRGNIYRYVTQAADTLCGTACSSAGTVDHRRVTVAVTVTGRDGPANAQVLSTIMIDPAAQPSGTQTASNPVQTTAGTTIGASTGTTYYFTDTPVGAAYSAPASDHVARGTFAAGSGIPDQLRTAAPSAPLAVDHLHTAYTYSTDVAPGSAGGLGLISSSSCSGGTTTTAHFWTTPVLNAGATVTATGNGALEVSMLSLGGLLSGGNLCVGVYDTTLDASSRVTSRTLLGTRSYNLPAWPTAPELVAFPFRYLSGTQTASIVAGHRLGVELTATVSPASGLAMIYDHPDWPSAVQLETQ